MAKWVHADVLDGGLNAIKTVATKMMLIKAYTAGDSYATVATTNKIAEVTVSSADFTLGTSGSNRTLTTATKSATATAAATGTPNLHIAFTDGSAKVLWVTDETSDVTVAVSDTVNFPALVYTNNQPT